MNEAEYMDKLGLVKHEAVKALCLAWDVQSDFFDVLRFAVEAGDWTRVRMLCEFDAVAAGAKAELVNEIISKIHDLAEDGLRELRQPAEAEGASGSRLKKALKRGGERDNV